MGANLAILRLCPRSFHVISCSCSHVELSRLEIPASGHSKLTINVKNGGKSAGPSSAKVAAYCDNEDWIQVFELRYVFEGVRFPDRQLVFSATDETVAIPAIAFVESKPAEDPVVSLSLVGKSGSLVSETKLVKVEQDQKYWKCHLLITIPNSAFTDELVEDEKTAFFTLSAATEICERVFKSEVMVAIGL